ADLIDVGAHHLCPGCGGAHGDGLAAAGAKVVGADVDEVGREVVDQPGRLGGGLVGGDDTEPFDLNAGHRRTPPGVAVRSGLSTTARIRSAMRATSRSGAMPKPELSRLRPPMKWTGARPSTLRRTSSIICPWLFSYTATALTPSAADAMASDGNGTSVIGRTY